MWSRLHNYVGLKSFTLMMMPFAAQDFSYMGTGTHASIISQWTCNLFAFALHVLLSLLAISLGSWLASLVDWLFALSVCATFPRAPMIYIEECYFWILIMPSSCVGVRIFTLKMPLVFWMFQYEHQNSDVYYLHWIDISSWPLCLCSVCACQFGKSIQFTLYLIDWALTR